MRNNTFISIFFCVTSGLNEDDLGSDEAEIINISNIILDINKHETIDVCEFYIKPLNTNLSDECKNLTHLNETFFDDSISFQDFFKQFEKRLLDLNLLQDGNEFVLLTDGPLHLRQAIIPECYKKQINIPDYFFKYFDLKKEFKTFTKCENLFSLSDICDVMQIKKCTEFSYSLNKCKMMVETVLQMIQNQHLFSQPELISKEFEQSLCSIDDNIEENTIIRIRGLPWQCTDSDVNKFFAGLNIANGGVALCLSPQGRRNGEALVRFKDEENRNLALKRHKHHIGQRYIEVYRATGKEFLSVAGVSGQNFSWKCEAVESLLEIETTAQEFVSTDSRIDIYYQYVDCTNCDLLFFSSLTRNTTNPYKLIGEEAFDAHYSYYFEVILNKNSILCPKFRFDDFGECGQFKLEIFSKNNCTIKNTVKSNNMYIVLSYGIPLIILLIILCNLFEKYYTRLKKSLCNYLNSKIGSTEEIELKNQKEVENKKDLSKQRYLSLDAFRGFSLILMIFVIYGWHTFDITRHKVWHGVNLASVVFPWFIWISGVSVPISINALMKKSNSNRWRIFFKITWRSIKLFSIGFFLLNINYEFEISKLRYFGVLQRIALCYFFVACIELKFWKKIDLDKYKNSWKTKIQDLIYSIPHFIVVHLLLIVWFLIVFLLPVPGCPKGYFGPGGLVEHGKYFNCTGGATGYVDRIILGLNHMYDYPTTLFVYKTDNYEPEGFVGTLTSICLAFYGAIAGRILIFYKDKKIHMILWVFWGLFTFILFGALTQFDLENGWIPCNKNIWTYTHTLISASTGFFILALLYFFIDYKNWWNGNPFIYPGKNSIVVYVGHILFARKFPVQWKTPYIHHDKFLMCTWGSFFWILVSAFLYSKDIFVNI